MNKTFAGKLSIGRLAVTHRLVDVNERSRFIRSCSFRSVCFPQSASKFLPPLALIL